MSIVQYHPWANSRGLQDEIKQVFDRFLGEGAGDHHPLSFPARHRGEVAITHRAEVEPVVRGSSGEHQPAAPVVEFGPALPAAAGRQSAHAGGP